MSDIEKIQKTSVTDLFDERCESMRDLDARLNQEIVWVELSVRASHALKLMITTRDCRCSQCERLFNNCLTQLKSLIDTLEPISSDRLARLVEDIAAKHELAKDQHAT